LRGRLCRRAVTYVGLKPIASPPPQSDGRDVLVFPETRLAQVQIGIVPTCHAAGQSDLAFVQPATDEAGASAALLWIADLQKLPAAKQFRAVRVTCSSELKPNACWRGARATLARLPLRRAAIMDRLIPEIHGKQGWILLLRQRGLAKPIGRSPSTRGRQPERCTLNGSSPTPSDRSSAPCPSEDRAAGRAEAPSRFGLPARGC
jgi:hypothetical protein